MAKMKIAVVLRPGADFELQERDIPQPPAGHARMTSGKAQFRVVLTM